jgi:hypothetical protein
MNGSIRLMNVEYRVVVPQVDDRVKETKRTHVLFYKQKSMNDYSFSIWISDIFLVRIIELIIYLLTIFIYSCMFLFDFFLYVMCCFTKTFVI